MPREVSVALDPHVHSDGSYDGHEPVERLLERAVEVGLDGIVVTDHDTIEQSLRAAELAPQYGLVGIPGVEVSTAQGHLLAIGVEACPKPGRSFADTVDVVREMGGVAVVPHPSQRTRHGVRRRHVEDCDAVEVYNAWVFTGYRNRRARRFAATSDYPGIAASDAHSAAYVGRAYTELLLEVESLDDLTADRIVAELAADGATVAGRRQPLWRSTSHYVSCTGRKARGAVGPRRPSLRTVGALAGTVVAGRLARAGLAQLRS
ncbi:PHP-associated domain-containing protein [Halomarina oriensis]|uniref:Phosphoesterase n=1 Tax=Halomarina oriensis TaxID=671145 RepID=A0A6B0GLS2_9EURY|nr:PHP domain-containing protein [Halomarina oriensis]MWG35802.1 phosphoesterase [Halomarina oriensis]